MWLTGFEKLMPEGRSFPYKYLPRPGAHLTVTFGDPVPPEQVHKALDVVGTGMQSFDPSRNGRGTSTGWIGDEIPIRIEESDHRGSVDLPSETLKVRAEVTRIIQAAVESLGRSVCGDSLSSQDAGQTQP